MVSSLRPRSVQGSAWPRSGSVQGSGVGTGVRGRYRVNAAKVTYTGVSAAKVTYKGVSTAKVTYTGVSVAKVSTGINAAFITPSMPLPRSVQGSVQGQCGQGHYRGQRAQGQYRGRYRGQYLGQCWGRYRGQRGQGQYRGQGSVQGQRSQGPYQGNLTGRRGQGQYRGQRVIHNPINAIAISMQFNSCRQGLLCEVK